MISPINVVNSNIEWINLFVIKCTHCNHEMEVSKAPVNCPNCNTVLFDIMRKSTFTQLFIDSLSALAVPRNKLVKFINNGDVKVSDLGICTEMSIAVDINLQTKFGGQYKSFFIKDTFDTIKANNFKLKTSVG